MTKTRPLDPPPCPCTDPPEAHHMGVHMVKAEPRTGPMTFVRFDQPRSKVKPHGDGVSAIARVAAGIVRPATTREAICRILNSDDPDIHAALIAALVHHGALAPDEQWCWTDEGGFSRHRLATPWQESEPTGPKPLDCAGGFVICEPHGLAKCPWCEEAQ